MCLILVFSEEWWKQGLSLASPLWPLSSPLGKWWWCAFYFISHHLPTGRRHEVAFLLLSLGGIATGIVLNSYPSNRGKFVSPSQLQNEVGIHPLCHPSACICVSFAGGQEILWSRSERGPKSPSPCTFSLLGRAQGSCWTSEPPFCWGWQAVLTCCSWGLAFQLHSLKDKGDVVE